MKLITSIFATFAAMTFVVLAVRNLAETTGSLYFIGAIACLTAAAVIWAPKTRKA